MTTLPPPPPPNGRHPMLRTPLPPPPDRRHSTHELIEKPSVRPFLLDIQDDEFRSGHLLPKFPPVEALPKIEPETPGKRAWKRDLLHAFEILAVGAVVGVVGATAFVAAERPTTSSGAAGAPVALGHSLDPFPNLFPIGPVQKVALAPKPTLAPTAKAEPAKPKPAKVWTAPAAVTKKAEVAKPEGVASSAGGASSEPAKPEPAKAEPKAAEPPPESPALGVENPGF